MKRIVSIIAVLSALSVAETLNAQCTDCEVKGISTDPRDDNAQNCEDEDKRNRFYWFNSEFEAYYASDNGNQTAILYQKFLHF